MMKRVWIRAGVAVVLAGVLSSPAHAQTFEAVGTRAQGLGGAFVAVADDATASWWNPAGLATGAYFNAVFERGRTTEPRDPDEAAAAPARRRSTGGFSIAFPALGLSYYRLRISEIGPVSATAGVAGGREDPAGTVRAARSVRYSQYGATVGQSLGDHIVLGSTVKLIRSGNRSTVIPNGESPLDTADDISTPGRTRVGLDAGAMASFGIMRLGVSVRNIKEVEVGSEEDPLRLTRQARAGVALFGGKRGVLEAITVAADADLTSSQTLSGDVRRVASGVEAWLFARRLGVRGGVSASAIGELRPVGSAGLSVAPFTGVYVEGAWSEGRDASLRGWTASLRVTF
jgi:hypothetical protein